MSKTNFIVINGQKYNAATGELIRTNESDNQTAPAVKETIKVVDGVSRSKSRRTPLQHKKKSLQRSATLVRKGVKKPTEKTLQQQNVSGITKSQLGAHPQRLSNATRVKKSPQIDKYGPDTHRSSVRKTMIAQLPVKTEQQSHQHNSPEGQDSSQRTSAPAIKQAAQSIIESAMQSAQSHTQKLLPEHTPPKKSLHHKLGISKRVARTASASLAALLLVGFFALQNIPNLSMRVAAARSGVDSSMPSYTPSGFAFRGPINYETGVVTVSFASNTDDRSYSVRQENSAWTSDSLLNEFVTKNAEQYQTYLDGRGRTLYIYDRSNATWVQDGIWYRVEGNSKLTTDQLARLAASM